MSDAKARELFRSLVMDEARAVPMIAAALRQAADDALELAAREAEALSSNYDKERAEIADGITEAIRALASPAAAPAADGPKVTPRLQRDAALIEKLMHPAPPEPDTGPDYDGDDPPSGPVVPSAITYVNAEQWAAAGQPPLDDRKLRDPGCQCHQEEGDSPCPVHGEEEPTAPSLLPRVLAFLDFLRKGNALGFSEAEVLAAELRRYIAEVPHG